MSGSGAPDNGLQPERTLLAWQRTLFGLVAAVLLYLRIPVGDTPGGAAGRLLVVSVLLGACAVLVVHLRWRWRRPSPARTARPAPLARPWTLVLLSAVVTGLAVATALSALLR